MTDTRSADDAKTLAKHAPLPLPAGSFTLQDLEKIGDAAVKAKPDERDTIVANELEKANRRSDKTDVPGQLPGHTVKEVERVLVEGVEQPKPGGKKGETEVVGEVKVTEHIQVFDPKKADEEEDATAEATAATGGAAMSVASREEKR